VPHSAPPRHRLCPMNVSLLYLWDLFSLYTALPPLLILVVGLRPSDTRPFFVAMALPHRLFRFIPLRVVLMCFGLAYSCESLVPLTFPFPFFVPWMSPFSEFSWALLFYSFFLFPRLLGIASHIYPTTDWWSFCSPPARLP